MNDDNKKSVNPVSVGLAGMVIGAAAGAAAVALSDEKNRNKLQKTVNNLKKEGSKRLDDWKSKAQELESGAKKQIEEANSKFKKTDDTGKPEETP